MVTLTFFKKKSITFREWDKDPFRFRDRVVDICSGLGPRSTLTVVTDMDPA
jgi:hypothetical protein